MGNAGGGSRPRRQDRIRREEKEKSLVCRRGQVYDGQERHRVDCSNKVSLPKGYEVLFLSRDQPFPERIIH